jgi:hypothetical protein
VVLTGEAYFFAVEPVAGRPAVVRTLVRTGAVLLCPAGMAHTFGSRGLPFTVVSFQARFVEPSEPDFAADADGFDGLPVVSRDL